MSKGQNLQDNFLNTLRKEHTPVSIFLVNGIKLQGKVDSFDQLALGPLRARAARGPDRLVAAGLRRAFRHPALRRVARPEKMPVLEPRSM